MHARRPTLQAPLTSSTAAHTRQPFSAAAPGRASFQRLPPSWSSAGASAYTASMDTLASRIATTKW